MRIAIAGAGKVGLSLAEELAHNGHQVMLIDRDAKVSSVALPGVVAVRADACEVESLAHAHLEECAVMIAATGDDKANLVISLLAKTEFSVPRVVARVNHPNNEWMFDDRWGVDVAVSTPRMLSALVEEAVTSGDLVQLMSLRKGSASLMEFTLTAENSIVGHAVGSVAWPVDTALACILRDDNVITPTGDEPLEVGDELIFVASPDQEQALMTILKQH